MPEKKEKPPAWEAWREGKRKEVTYHEECIPNMETLLSMQKAGYTFKRDGKAWKPKK